MSSAENNANFAMGLVMGLAVGGIFGGACGYVNGTKDTKPKIEAAAHYAACKLVRTIKPANTAEVECYDCAGVEECVVPFWRSP